MGLDENAKCRFEWVSTGWPPKRTSPHSTGSRSKVPCAESSIRWPSVLVEVLPRKIRDGVAKAIFCCKRFVSCKSVTCERNASGLSLPSITY